MKKDKQIGLYYLASKLTLLPLKKSKLTQDILTKCKAKGMKKIALWVHFENSI